MALNCRTHLSQLVVKVTWWDRKISYSFTEILQKKFPFMLLFLIMIAYSHNVTASWKVMFSALAPFFKNKTKKWWGAGENASEKLWNLFCGGVHCWINPCACGIVTVPIIYSVETSSTVFTKYIVMDFGTFIYLDVHNGSE